MTHVIAVGRVHGWGAVSDAPRKLGPDERDYIWLISVVLRDTPNSRGMPIVRWKTGL